MDISARMRALGKPCPITQSSSSTGWFRESSTNLQNDAGTLAYPRAGKGESPPRAKAHHRNEEQHFISMRWSSSLR